MKSVLLLLALAVAAAASETPKLPTFGHDIAPIIYQNCAPCHRRGQAAPFSLLTYQDVKKHARQIANVTKRRYMPPWPPEPGYGDFQDERRLTDEQIRMIGDWVRAGAPEGPANDAPPPPQFASDWQLGEPDLVLQAARPFLLPASGPDVFWNFIFHPDLKTTHYVRAIEIRPGADRLVHHANLLIDRTGSTRRLEATPGAGFPGMELTIDRNPLDPDSHFLFWKPGTVPYSEPDGFSWRLDPGNFLVLNAHLQPSGKVEQVRPTIGLYFTDKPPTRFPLLIQLEHDGALDIPAGVRDFMVSDDFRIPIDADVLAVYPHAHYLGKLLEAYATLPDGTRKWLIRIPDWDLNWQAVYRYREPVFLPKGSVISMRYHYDNSASNVRNPNNPPKRVHAGNRATDEMGHLWLQVLPRGRGDHRRPLQEAIMRHRLEKYPNDFSAHLNLGALLLSRLDAQGAVSMLEAAVRINPARPEGHDMLGSALEALGRSSDALEQFRLALRAQPDYVDARYNLALALAKFGKFGEAIENFRPVAAAYPGSARLQDEFGELLARDGKFVEAVAQFDKALALDPSDETAKKNREVARQQMAGR
ncbi:MAG TPA: tetratricopeptide repeat protein [Bryobacteraceae bacterium]|nr:tetratricopeptide repeat protein [Bryobacteraceae bacterium]